MKTTILLITIFLSSILFAQPSKNFLTDAFLRNDSLFATVNGVSSFKGQVMPALKLDANRNLIIGNGANLISSVGNLIQAENVQLNRSHNNAVFAKNIVIESASGTFSAGADHTIKVGADYSAVFNDANRSGGESMFIGGENNWGYNDYGTMFGLNNTQGSLSRPSLVSNKYLGGFLSGNGLSSEGNEVTMFGINFTSTQTGFHVGYGREMFSVLPDGKVVINGHTITIDNNNLYVDGHAIPYNTISAITTQFIPQAVISLDGKIIGFTQKMR